MSEHPLIRTSIRFALFAGAAMLPATGVIAQDQPESEPQDSTLQEVVVTGSRIVSPNLDSPSPVQTITCRRHCQTTGILNVQDILLKNPTFGTPTLSRTNSNFLTSGAGVATVDLRNLGIERTLTLIDGRRFVSGIPGSAAVDYNTIPTQFIERIDVLTGGASAVYGSDAVAGVVNIISRRISKASPSTANTAPAPRPTTRRRSSALTFGTNTADDRGNVMGYVGYTKQGAVYSRDRERSAIDQVSTGARRHG